MIRIDICDAATSRRDAVQSALIERIEPRQHSSGRADLLHLGQLVCSNNLSGGDHVLYLGDDKRNDGHGPTNAGCLAYHADLEHLRLDLIEACKKPLSPAPSGIRMPAALVTGAGWTMSPTRNTNWSTLPLTPA